MQILVLVSFFYDFVPCGLNPYLPSGTTFFGEKSEISLLHSTHPPPLGRPIGHSNLPNQTTDTSPHCPDHRAAVPGRHFCPRWIRRKKSSRTSRGAHDDDAPPEDENSDADDVVDDDASAFSAKSCPDATDRDICYNFRHCPGSDCGDITDYSKTESGARPADLLLDE